MPDPADAGPRGRIRKAVGRPRERTPRETVWRLRLEHRALGLPTRPPMPTVANVSALLARADVAFVVDGGRGVAQAGFARYTGAKGLLGDTDPVNA